MLTLSENDFMKIYFDSNTGIFEYHWTSRNGELNDEGYQNELIQVMQFVHEYKPKFVMADTKYSSFVVHIEMQKWLIDNVIVPTARLGMKKLAIIVSEYFFTQLSVEQAIDDTTNKPFETKYFDNAEDGRIWLRKFSQ